MAALLTLAGDIETNPGPPFKTTPQQTTYLCSLCNKVINIRRQWSIECNSTQPHWVHKSCITININDYHPHWTCKNHNPAHLNTQNTTFIQPQNHRNISNCTLAHTTTHLKQPTSTQPALTPTLQNNNKPPPTRPITNIYYLSNQ